jgi:hypothetical protein
MGLSNEERYSKILWTVKNIEDKLAELKKDYSNDKLKSFSGKLWPALLNNDSNGGFWLFGGGFSKTEFEGGFLCEALSVHKPAEKDPFFSSEKNYIESNLHLPSIIGDYNSTESTLVEIYQWIENFYYAANRYKDEFSEAMPELKNLIANLKGELFNTISRDPIYLRGYLLYQIFSKCIEIYDKECPLTKLIDENYLFHNFKLQDKVYHKTENLLNTWREIQFKYTRDIPLDERIYIVLALMGRKIGDDYRQKEIKKQILPFVDEVKLNEVFDYCKTQKELEKQLSKESLDRHIERKFCQLTDKY